MSTKPEPKYSQKVLDAARKTIAAYDRAIAARNVVGWENFGDTRFCRLCVACGDCCSKCPLSMNRAPVSCANDTAEAQDTFAALDRICVKSDDYPVSETVSALTARRAFLIKRLKENGVEVEHLAASGT